MQFSWFWLTGGGGFDGYGSALLNRQRGEIVTYVFIVLYICQNLNVSEYHLSTIKNTRYIDYVPLNLGPTNCVL